MDSKELLKRAWESVAESGVPEALQETAFKEAVQFLKEQEGIGPAPAPAAPAAAPVSPARAVTPSTGQAVRATPTPKGGVPEFFRKVEHESGVSAGDLMSVLVVEDDTVQVLTPTRSLGGSKAEQTRNVVALVAGARHAGMDEDPVPGAVVRDECKRKRCYDEGNFSNSHVAQMKGFNLHNRDIKLTARWVDEFTAAIKKALGTDSAPEE